MWITIYFCKKRNRTTSLRNDEQSRFFVPKFHFLKMNQKQFWGKVFFKKKSTFQEMFFSSKKHSNYKQKVLKMQ